MISPSLRKSLPLLKVVSKLTKENRKKILSQLGGEDVVYNALREIAHNTIKGNIKLNNIQKSKLKPYSRTLKELCSTKSCKNKRKKLVVQSGGFLPILIPAVASIISSLVARNV